MNRTFERREVKLRKMMDYCNEQGIVPFQLTLKERELFLGESLGYQYFAMAEKKPCTVCSELTGSLSHGYELYLCGDDCFRTFQESDENNHPELYKLRKQKIKEVDTYIIRKLLTFGYNAEDMNLRMECPLDEIKSILKEIQSKER